MITDYQKFIKKLQATIPGSFMELMGINFETAGEGYLTAKMEVLKKFHQPFEILHGGVFAVLAETVASAASFLYVSELENEVRGMSLNLNHLKSIKSGIITAKAETIHLGRQTHLWDIKIRDRHQKLLSVGRQTNIIIPRNK